MRATLLLSLALLLGASQTACDSSSAEDAGVGADAPGSDLRPGADAEPDAGPRDLGGADSGARDALASDAAGDGDATSAVDAGPSSDAGPTDAGGAPDAGVRYNCGLFETDPGWTVTPGFRAVEIATAADGLSQPVALTFAGTAYGDELYVVDQGNSSVFAVDVLTGGVRPVVTSTRWTPSPRLLTTITWDEDSVFDGQLYVGDQGGDGDADSTIYEVAPSGVVSLFTAAPGPGLDDIYALAFTDGTGGYVPGLYVSGDTDGAGDQWGRFDASGVGVAFSNVSGIEGALFDRGGQYGGALIAARPLGGGYSGDGSISIILPDGTLGSTLAAGLGGVHAPAMSSGGAFGTSLYAASWSTGRLYRIEPSGAVEIASGLSLTNYDGNILAFSPDGNVLFVADRLASRVVCIEPTP